VSNTEFEGGGDGHGHSEGTFLVKQAPNPAIYYRLLPTKNTQQYRTIAIGLRLLYEALYL
jgi:hypothetical protein